MSEEGEIKARLTLDGSQFRAEIEAAKTEVDSLKGSDPKITVNVNVGLALTQLKSVLDATERLTAADARLRGVEESLSKANIALATSQGTVTDLQARGARQAAELASVSQALKDALQRQAEITARLSAAEAGLAAVQREVAASAEKEAAAEEAAAIAKNKSAAAGRKSADATKQQVNAQGLLIGSLVAVSAAAPPVAAAAVGITGAFLGMGVAGVLAVTGISRELKAGKGEGLAYAGIVSSLRNDLYSLQDSAQRGLLPGAQQSVSYLHGVMPFLNTEVHQFGAELGAILPTGLDAVVTLLERSQPLLQAGADYLYRFMQGIDGFAHSDAFGNFIQYAVTNLPQVEQFLNVLLHTVGDFLGAWAPLGAVTLPMLTDLLQVIDHIIRTTGPLVPLAIAVGGAFSAWGSVAPMVMGIASALNIMGDSAATAGAKVATAEVAAEGASGAGGLLAGAAGLLGKTGGLKGLGVSAAGLLAGGYIVSQTGGNGSVGGDLAGIGGGALAGASIGRYAGPIGAGVGALLGATVGSVYANRNNYGGGATAGAQTATYGASWNGYAGAAPTGSAGPKMGGGDTSYGGFGASGAAAAATAKDTAAVQANTQADIANTAAKQKQTIAASQLGSQYATLDGIINAANTAAYTNVTSYNAAQTALVNLTSTLKTNKGAWSDHTAAGLADRTAVDQAVAAISAHAVAINADGQHAQQATDYTNSHIVSLVKEAEAAGISKSQITAYVAKLLGVPKSVVTEILAEDKASAKANAAMQAAHRFSIGKYESILEANGVPADRATKMALEAAQKWARTHATATLDADTKRAIAAARYAAGVIDAMHANIQVTASVNNLGIAGGPRGNGTGYGGMASGGTVNTMFPGAAYGMSAGYSGTVTGPGTAATDQAGLFRLANGEEVVSDLYKGAQTFRPLLKGISSGKVRTPQDVARAVGMGASSGPQTVVNRTIAPQIHLHNPVAVDPVAQSTEAAQLALAYAGLA